MPPARRGWWPGFVIGVFICLFAVVISRRNEIRAHWWALRLIGTDDPQVQAYLLASLAAVGDSAAGPVKRLARHDRAEVRSLAVVALARLPEGDGVDGLARLLDDPVRDVAASAALSLAFLEGESATNALIEAARSPRPAAAAAAVAALCRVDAARALTALCLAAGEHPHPWVRAQAVESLGAWVLADPRPMSQTPASLPGSASPLEILVSALSDRAEFVGLLSLEREIASAATAVRGRTGAEAAGVPPAAQPPISRTVAEIAAASIARLTGRRLDHDVVRTPAQQAGLLEECRRLLAARCAAVAAGEGKRQSVVPGSADTPSATD